MTPFGMKSPFCQLWSAVPAISPLKHLCILSVLAVGGVWEVEKVLTLPSSYKNIPVLLTLWSAQIQTTALYQYYEQNEPYPSQK